MFDEALAELVRDTGAELAIFCDYEGEAIAFAPRGPDDFDVRITGAQLGASIVAAQQVAVGAAQGERMGISCVCERRTLIVEALPGNYYLVLSVRRASLEPFARRRLRAVAERFAREL